MVTTIIRNRRVWIVYRENLKTGTITPMGVNLNRVEAKGLLKSYMDAGYNKEIGYVFTIESFIKRVTSTVTIKDVGKEENDD